MSTWGSWGASTSWGGTGEGDDDLENEENEDLPDEVESRWLNKDSILFAIDCSAAMFVKGESDKETPFALAIRCASSLLQDKIISSENDLVGIMLYGTEKKRNVSGFENIYMLQELDVPSAERILELEDLLSGRVSAAAQFGHMPESVHPSIGNVLWVASMTFGNSTVKVGSKRVFMFTNECDPHSGDVPGAELAKTRAKDLADLGIEIELFSIHRPGATFQFDLFWEAIVRVDEDDTAAGRFPSASEHFEQLMDRVRRKEFKKRTMLRIPFFLTDKMELGVRLYNLVSEAKKGSYVWLDSRSNEEVRPSTRYVTDAGEVVSVKDMKSYYVFGGEKVLFDREELEQARDYGPPGLYLMGFKPRGALKRKYALKHGLFVYPNDSDVQGSSVAFAALLERMAAKDKIAIARFVPRATSAPRFVALLPQLERFDESGVQVDPPGMHLIYLPYSDDLRKLAHEEDAPRAPSEVVDRMRRVVTRLELVNFTPQDYENPALQRHYANLQALALNQDVPEETPDLTLPNIKGIIQRAGKDLSELRATLFPDGYVQLSATKGRATASKRGAADGDDGEDGARKRARAAAEPDDLTIDSVRKMRDAGTLAKLTVPHLKEFLHSVGVRAKARKNELLDQVNDYLDKA